MRVFSGVGILRERVKRKDKNCLLYIYISPNAFVYENELLGTIVKMNDNTSKKRFAEDRDILFGIPDTGIRVSWDFSAGCGTSENDKKGTNLRPITPKPVKYPPKVYRRRCLNQIKIPAEGDDAFAEEMLSLVRVSRKSIIKSSPGVSPKGRSPRNLRSKPKPSPLRDEDFHFLLNDSIDNDDMIRCSQLTEAALKEEEVKSPVAMRVSSAKRLALSRNVGSPLTRKKLLDAITTSQKGSPLRPSTVQPVAAPAKVKTEPSVESADQCNNNVVNVENELPRKSPRRLQLPFGVTPITPKQGNGVATSIKTEPEIKLSPADPADDLDDGMDFELELTPNLLELLDGHVEGPNDKVAPKVEPVSEEELALNSQPRLKSEPLSATASAPGKSSSKACPSLAAPKSNVSPPSIESKAPQVMPSTSFSALSLSQSKQPTSRNTSTISTNHPTTFQQVANNNTSAIKQTGAHQAASSHANKMSSAPSSVKLGAQQNSLSLSKNTSAPSSGASAFANKNTQAPSSGASSFANRNTPGPSSLANKNTPGPSSLANKNTSAPSFGASSLANKNTSASTSGASSLANKNTSAPTCGASSFANRNTLAPAPGPSSLANKNTSAPSPGGLSLANKNTSASSGASSFANRNTSAPTSGASSLANRNTSAPSSGASSFANRNTLAPAPGPSSLANKNTSAPSSGASSFAKRNTLAPSSLANKNSSAPSSGASSSANRNAPAPSSGPLSLANKNSCAPSPVKQPGAQQGALPHANKGSSAPSSNHTGFPQGNSSVAPKNNSAPSLRLPVAQQHASQTKSVTPSLSQTMQGAIHPSDSLSRPASAPGRTSQTGQPTPKPNAPPVQSSGPVRQCTPAEIERKRQEALRKLKLRSQSK